MAEEEYEKRLDGLKKDVNELRVLLKDVAEGLKQERTEEGDLCMSTIRDGLGRCTEWVKERTDTLKSGGRKAISRMEHRVERKPIASVLTAVGVGFILGKVLTRR